MAQLVTSTDSEFWATFIGSKNLEAERPPEEDFDSVSYSLQHLLPPENQPDVETIRKTEASINQRLVEEELQQFQLSLFGDNQQPNYASTSGTSGIPQAVILDSNNSELVAAYHPQTLDPTLVTSQPLPSSPESPHSHSGSIESSGYGSPASPPISQNPDESAVAMKELLDRISWKTPVVDMKKRRKPERDGPVTEDQERERHKQTEKKRREDINDAVKQLRTLLPSELQERRASQVEILSDAVAYFARVQQLAMNLIVENRKLSQSSAASAPAPAPPPVAKQPSSTVLIATAAPARTASVRDGTRLFFIMSFLLMTNFWMPVLLSYGRTAAVGYTGRLLKGVDYVPTASTTHCTWGAWIGGFFIRLLWFYIGLAVLFIVSIIPEYFFAPPVAIPPVMEALKKGMQRAHKGQSHTATRHFLEALSLLNRPFPDTTVSLVLFVALRYLRVLMAVFCIGRRIERLFLRLGRQSPTALALEALVYEGLMYQDTPLVHRPLTNTAISLAMLSATLPLRSDTPLKGKLCDTITYRVPSPWQTMVVLLAQLLTRGRDEASDRALWLPGQRLVRSGRYDEARLRWENSLAHTHLPEYGRRRLLVLFAVTYLLEDDCDRCVAMSAEAARLSAKHDDLQALMWSITIGCFALLRLQRLPEAAALLERLAVAAKDHPAEDTVYRSVTFACPTAHLAYYRGQHEKVLVALKDAVEALNRSPNVYEHMVCVNSIGMLIHQVWQRALQKDAPAVLVKVIPELDKLSAEVLRNVSQSAHPCHTPALIPCYHRMRGMRLYLLGDKTGALSAWETALKSAKNLNLPYEETQAIQLKEQFGGAQTFNV